MPWISIVASKNMRQTVSHITVALVYLYALLVVDVTEHIVAGYDVAAVGEDKRCDVVFAYDDRLFLVEAFAHHKIAGLLFLLVVA